MTLVGKMLDGTGVVWGPPTPLMLAIEREAEATLRAMQRGFAPFYYGPPPVLPYRLPQSVLRRRAMYGGRKGRAAIKRLKAMGARPMQRSGDEE